MRALTATGVVAVSIWSLNLSGSAGAWEASGAVAAGPRAGTATAGEGRPDGPASDSVGAGMLQATDLTNPGALVAFPHAAIGGYRGESSLPRAGTTGFGRPPAGFLMAPLALLNASSPFGFRVSPLSGAAGDFHLGQDYAAPCGTSVYAADSGLVRAAGWHPWGGGNRVEIDHGNGLITTYNHLEAIAVRTGDEIQAGQVVGKVGSTGWSTGCHLHFETILNGRHTSPLKWGLMPARALGSGSEEMRSYLPGFGSPSERTVSWALPLPLDHDHNHPHDVRGGAGMPARPASPPWLRPATASVVVRHQPSPSTAPSTTDTSSAASSTPTAPAPSPSAPSSTPAEVTPTPAEVMPPTPAEVMPSPPAEVMPSPPAEVTPSPTPVEVTPTPAPTPAEPSPTLSTTPIDLTVPEVTLAPSPLEAATSPAPDLCPAEPAQETPDPSPESSQTSLMSELLLADTACEIPVRDPAAPE